MECDSPAKATGRDIFVPLEDLEWNLELAELLCEEETADAGADYEDRERPG